MTLLHLQSLHDIAEVYKSREHHVTVSLACQIHVYAGLLSRQLDRFRQCGRDGIEQWYAFHDLKTRFFIHSSSPDSPRRLAALSAFNRWGEASFLTLASQHYLETKGNGIMSIEHIPWNAATNQRRMENLIERAEKGRDFFISKWTKESLAQLRIQAKEGEEHLLALISGEELGSARNRRTEAIHREGARRRLLKPSPDAALLFKENLPVEAKEYRQIVFMHKPIRDRDQHPSLLCWERKIVRGTLRRVLTLLEAYPGTIWPRDAAFVFLSGSHWTAALAHPKAAAPRSHSLTGGHPRPCWAI